MEKQLQRDCIRGRRCAREFTIAYAVSEYQRFFGSWRMIVFFNGQYSFGIRKVLRI